MLVINLKIAKPRLGSIDKICSSTTCEIMCFHRGKHKRVRSCDDKGCLYDKKAKCVEVK